MNKNKGIWIGFVAILVIGALLTWWLVAQRPLSTSTGDDGSANQAQESGATAPEKTTVGENVVITKVNRASQTVNTIISGLSGTSQFRSLYSSTGVSAQVTASGRYTIFVPTNGAFAQLSGGTISNLTADEKKRLVQYHVVADRAIDVDAEVVGTITALSGDELNFNYGANKIPLVNSAIVITEYVGKNGIVYLIDNVLLPPKKAPGTL